MTTVLVVSGVRLYRDGLADVLGREDGIDVVGAVSGWREALGALAVARTDVVVLDAAVQDALGGARRLAGARGPEIVVIGVTEDEAEVIAWAEAGVSGYVNRDSPLAHLVAAIIGAGRGELLCSPRVAGALLRRVSTLSRRQASRGRAEQLTVRELEIVKLLEEGLSNKEIAQRLWIELPTVKNHVHNILEKLEVRRRTEAVARARREGVLDPL